jgi:hypothetical protein
VSFEAELGAAAPQPKSSPSSGAYVKTDAATGEAQSRVYSETEAALLDHDALLVGWRLDPADWEIIDGTLQVNRWQQHDDSDAWLYQYKAKLRVTQHDLAIEDVPPLVRTKTVVQTRRVKRDRPPDLLCAALFPDGQISYWMDSEGEWRTTHDEAALDIVHQQLADAQAEHGIDLVCDHGDLLDCTQFSTHRSAPAQIERIGFKRSIARAQQELEIRTALTPDAERWWIPGNHEQRIINWLTDNAPWLLDLSRPGDVVPALSLEWLLDTERHGWKVAAPYPEGIVWLNSNTRCIHGWVAKSVPGASAAEYLKDEVNTFFGHTPRAQTVQRTVARGAQTRTYVAHTSGGLMRVDGAVPSATTATTIKGEPALERGERWDQGWTLVWYHPEGTTVPVVEHIPIFGGRSVWRGREYVATCDVDGRPLT